MFERFVAADRNPLEPTAATQISSSPLRSLTNAIESPPGDHDGWVSLAGSPATAVAADPSDFTTQMSYVRKTGSFFE
jgi:hypothetical protein